MRPLSITCRLGFFVFLDSKTCNFSDFSPTNGFWQANSEPYSLRNGFWSIFCRYWHKSVSFHQNRASHWMRVVIIPLQFITYKLVQCNDVACNLHWRNATTSHTIYMDATQLNQHPSIQHPLHIPPTSQILLYNPLQKTRLPVRIAHSTH